MNYVGALIVPNFKVSDQELLTKPPRDALTLTEQTACDIHWVAQK
jgi:hypothetical protein